MDQWFLSDDFNFLRAAQTTPWDTWIVQSFSFTTTEPVPEFGLEVYRPLFLLAFRAEYSVFGLSAFGYHALNVTAHMLAVVVLWHVALRLFPHTWAAHLAALIFAIHPAYGDAIAWISNGNTVFAVLFILLAFLLFMKYRDKGLHRFCYYAAFLVSLVAALLLHPGIMPSAVAIAVWYFLADQGPARMLHPRAWLPLVLPALVVISLVAVWWWIRDDNPALRISYGFGSHMYDNYIDYLGLALYPAAQESTVRVVGAAVMLLVTATLLSQWRWSWHAVFAVLWLYGALLPASTFVFGTAGRLLYPAGPALAILLATLAMRIWDWLQDERLRRRIHPWEPSLRILAPLAAALFVFLFIHVRGAAMSTFALSPDDTMARQMAANKDFARQLRSEVRTISPNGMLYVFDPPFNLIILSDNALESLVQLYYGEVRAESVPLQSREQILTDLGSDDQFFTLDRGEHD